MSERTVVIRTSDSRYFSANINGDGLLTAAVNEASAWETFTLVDHGSGVHSLRAYNGSYVRVDPSRKLLYADAGSPGPSTFFTLTPASGGQKLRWQSVDALLSISLQSERYVTLGLPALSGPLAAALVEKLSTFTIVDWVDPRFKRDRKIGLQASCGHWVCAESDGAAPLIANRGNWLGWETFTLRDLGAGRVALIACNGRFVRADETGNRLIADRAYLSPTEMFLWKDLGNNQISLRSSSGRYVAATDGPNQDATLRLSAGGLDRSTTFTATFEPVPLPKDRRIAIRTLFQFVFSAEGGGTAPLTAPRKSIGDNEAFTLKHVSLNQVALIACNGRYVRAAEDGTKLVADRDSRGPSETFTLKRLGANRYTLLAANGKYVSATSGGGSSVVNSATQVQQGESFTFIDLYTFVDGSVVTFRADNGQYVSRFTRDGIDEIRPVKPASDAYCRFTVKVMGDRIALQADNGKFLSRFTRSPYEPVEAAKTTIDPYCLFKVVQQGAALALQADNGKFLSRVVRGDFERIEAVRPTVDSSCVLLVSA